MSACRAIEYILGIIFKFWCFVCLYVYIYVFKLFNKSTIFFYYIFQNRKYLKTTRCICLRAPLKILTFFLRVHFSKTKVIHFNIFLIWDSKKFYFSLNSYFFNKIFISTNQRSFFKFNTFSIHMHIISKSRIFKEICEKNQYTD